MTSAAPCKSVEYKTPVKIRGLALFEVTTSHLGVLGFKTQPYAGFQLPTYESTDDGSQC